jgi:hypothetical protein
MMIDDESLDVLLKSVDIDQRHHKDRIGAIGKLCNS